MPRHLARAGDLERGIAVMQEGHVGGAQGKRHGGHAFVAGRSDGVESLPRPLHGAPGAVQRAGGAGGAEYRHGIGMGQGAGGGRARRKIPRGCAGKKVIVDNIGAVHGCRFIPQLARSGRVTRFLCSICH